MNVNIITLLLVTLHTVYLTTSSSVDSGTDPVGVQDGTIKYEIKLTGELSTNPLSFGEESPEYGTLVMEGVNAQHHQHMFCARLDLAVDDTEGGKALYVTEVKVLKRATLCIWWHALLSTNMSCLVCTSTGAGLSKP